MQTLRHAQQLTRWVLVWFMLSIGVAIASPLVKPQALELVCSGSGAMKVLVYTDDGLQEQPAHHNQDCPLCAATGLPPAQDLVLAPAQQALSYALQPVAAAQTASRIGAPLPARGPPNLS